MLKQAPIELVEKMDFQDNPVEIERRSQHKSIKELEKEVGSKKSEICKLWRVKEKEKKSWWKCDDEVGWCYEHKDFCDVDSACTTWDPIPVNSSEGTLLLVIIRLSAHNSKYVNSDHSDKLVWEKSCLSLTVDHFLSNFQSSEFSPFDGFFWNITTLFYSAATMDNHRRHYQKFLKVLERHSFKTTWQFQRLKTIHHDMKKISKRNVWPFTSYSPQPHQKSIPGDFSDISPEELRYLRYTSNEDEYEEYERTLDEDYKGMRENLTMERWQTSINDPDERRLCRDADEIMLYLENPDGPWEHYHESKNPKKVIISHRRSLRRDDEIRTIMEELVRNQGCLLFIESMHSSQEGPYVGTQVPRELFDHLGPYFYQRSLVFPFYAHVGVKSHKSQACMPAIWINFCPCGAEFILVSLVLLLLNTPSFNICRKHA